MLDIKRIREDFDGVKKAVESRGKGDFGIDKVREYDVERRKLAGRSRADEESAGALLPDRSLC